MQYPIIYLHIPKTAGTSFRVSAHQYFGKDKILSDYGEDSTATTKDIHDDYYISNDISALQALGRKKKLLSGHFHLAKYREIFPDSPVMTFFRDPVKRVISEYVHFKNHFNYPGTLEEFYRSRQFQNKQHHTLSGAKPTDLDFYGLTERYDESLNLFNLRYQTKLPKSVLNKGNYSGQGKSVASENQIDEIKHLNQADLAIYQCAVDNFETQDSTTKTAINIATRFNGNLGGIRDNCIVGWVFERSSDQPVTIKVAINGTDRTTFIADHHRADILRNGMHQTGHCGFKIPLNDIGSISSDDSISVLTLDSNFELLNSPYIMS